MLRVLIVEDEPVIALELQDLLEDSGHTVVGIAYTMERALELAARAGPVDLAILDVDLSGDEDGIETARRLREDHDVASLFVSGRLTEENRARTLKWRPIGFIGKPFRAEQILNALEPLVTSLPPRT